MLTRASRLVLVPQAVLTDRQLLNRFAAEGAEDAFAALVRRHAGMVLGVCRRALPNAQDAEDACQATFLILARRAGDRWQESVANWLFATARKVARDARRAAERRARRERRAAVPEAVAAADRLAARELLRAVDEELGRLPPLYREPLVLYHLAELTRDEIAVRLGVPSGTVKTRLERGRRRLHAALTRRGLGAGAALLVIAAAHPAGAYTPRTVGAILAAVSGTPPAAVAVLARGATVSESIRKVGAGMCAVAVAAVAFGAVVFAAPPEPPPPAPAPRPAAERPSEHADAHGDPLPAGALLRIGTFRARDGGGTNHAALSPDGKSIATASEAGVTLFDLATGRRLLWISDSGVPNDFSPNNATMAFAPDGKALFVLSAPGAPAIVASGTITAYDPATGAKLRSFKPPPAPGGPNRRPDLGYVRVWAPAGAAHLVAVREDTTVLLDPTTGREVRSLPFAADVAQATPNGLRLFEAQEQGNAVAVYDPDGNRVRTLEHTTRPEVLGLDPAGAVLAVAGPGGQIRVWDVATGKSLANVALPETADKEWAVTALAVTPDLKTLLAGTQRGQIHRFDIATGKERPPLRGHTSYVTGLFVADGGRTLVSSGWDHRVARWDLATGLLLPDAGGYAGSLNLDRSPDGRWVAAADGTGLVELLDGATGRPVRVFQPAGRPPASRLAFAPDGGSVATAHGDARLRIWEPATGRLVREIEVTPAPKGRTAWFSALAFAPDGRALLSSYEAAGTDAFDPVTGKRLWGGAAVKGKAAFLPDGRSLVVGGWDSQLHFLDAATGKARTSVPSDHRVVDDVAVSPDGRSLATAHHDGFVCLRDPKTGAVQKEWQAHKPGAVAWGVSFGPGGIWLASAGDRTVAVWDAATGTLLRRFEGHTSRAYSARFGADGRTVLSSSLDLTGYVWDVRPQPGPAGRTTAQLWDDLAGEPAAAFRAVWLAATDPRAPAVFDEKLPPLRAPDPERFKKLVEGLADPDFKTREAAEKELSGLGSGALRLARAARAGTDSLEVRNRLDGLIRRWSDGAFTPESWRRKRAVVAMELAGTPAARELLKRWAADAPGTVLSDAAADALGRLDRIGRPESR